MHRHRCVTDASPTEVEAVVTEGDADQLLTLLDMEGLAEPYVVEPPRLTAVNP